MVKPTPPRGFHPDWGGFFFHLGVGWCEYGKYLNLPFPALRSTVNGTVDILFIATIHNSVVYVYTLESIGKSIT